MKTINLFATFIMLISMSVSCNAQNTEDNQNKSVGKTGEVTVYYFHNARRCVTCKTVEAEAEKAVKELYSDDVKFAAYNLEDETGAQKAEEVGVSGQTLLVVSGETKINLTNEGFMNARNNPEKLKQILKENIDPLF